MACSITITSVLGTPVSSTSTSVTIQGTASSCLSGKVNVSISCGGGTASSGSAVIQSNNTWSITLNSSCLCGSTVTVTATCTNDLSCFDTITTTLSCNCCPTIGHLQVQVGTCDASGNRPVNLTASVIIAQSACTPISVQWNYGDGNLGPVITYTTSGTFNLSATHTYSPGTYTATVVVITPTGCPSQQIQVVVPACPPPPSCCPSVSIGTHIGHCHVLAGTRTVTFTVTVTVPSGCPPATVIMDFDNGNFSLPYSGSGTFTFTTSQNYNAGATYTPSVFTVFPSGCPSFPVNINVPSCPAPCSVFPFNVFCNIARFLFLLYGIIAFISFFGGLCSGNSTFWAIFLASAIVGGLLLWFILNFCKKCLPCDWLYRTIGRILLIAAVACFAFIGCSPALVILLAMFTWGSLGFSFLSAWQFDCSISDCKFDYEVLYCVITGIAYGLAFAAAFNVLVPCMLANIGYAIFLWVILLAIWINKIFIDC